MQPWSHSNLISRCGTARVPHKHNCLLGTMISNEMRLHHHCNLSGKISTREWVPVPGVFSHIGSSTNSPSLSLALSFSLVFSFSRHLLNKCTGFVSHLWILDSFYKCFSSVFNAGQSVCKGNNDDCQQTRSRCYRCISSSWSFLFMVSKLFCFDF